MAKIRILRKKSKENDEFIALSDIMTALMLLFLLISIAYMINIESTNKKLEENARIPLIFKKTTQDLAYQLKQEFSDDLSIWGAVFDSELTIRFNQPDILFHTGSSELSIKFKQILDDFFPRYLTIIMNEEFIDNIEEIRIEGHTSSIWGNMTGNQAYLNNMALSQERTRAVLKYLINSPKLSSQQTKWLKKHFRAIGFASARTLNDDSEPVKDGEKENFKNSQRVEFRVRTNIESKISELLKN